MEMKTLSACNQTSRPFRSAGFSKQGFLQLWLPFFSLAAVVFVLYSNTYNVPFSYDDLRAIDNRHIRIDKLSLQTIYDAGFNGFSKRRPLANISFALNYYGHKYWLPGYHCVNIFIHISTTILLFLLVKATMDLPTVRLRYGSDTWVPFLAALFWSINPLQIQAVTYTVQRMTGLAAMFFMLSLLLYVRGRLTPSHLRKWWFMLSSFGAGILAVGSKENAYILPFFIIIYDWYFLRDLDCRWLKKKFLYPFGALVVIAMLAFVIFGDASLHSLLAGYGKRPFTMVERLLTETRVVFIYLSLLCLPLPSRLNLIHDIPISHSFLDPLTTLCAIAGIACLLLFACYRAKQQRIASFAIIWFLGNLAIESTFLPLALMYEHRLYLPSSFVPLAVIIAVKGMLQNRWARIGVTVGLALFFSICTYQRNALWAQPVAFWKDALQKTPTSARVHNNYGYHLSMEGRSQEAAEIFRQALRYDSTSQTAGRTYYNLGVIMGEMGRYDEAIRDYLQSDRLLPGQSITYANLGDMYERVGDLERAKSYLSKAVAIDPYDSIGQYNLALVYAKQKQYAEAREHYLQVLELEPGNEKSANDLKMVLYYFNRR